MRELLLEIVALFFAEGGEEGVVDAVVGDGEVVVALGVADAVDCWGHPVGMRIGRCVGICCPCCLGWKKSECRLSFRCRLRCEEMTKVFLVMKWVEETEW